jgi:hypothetical protein
LTDQRQSQDTGHDQRPISLKTGPHGWLPAGYRTQEGSSMAGQDPSPRRARRAEPDGTAASSVEQPTQAAELNLTVGPATAGGRVPQDDAHHFITVGGIAWCVAAAIAGVVLTLQVAGRSSGHDAGSGPVVLALAELGLGLIASAFIAACGGRTPRRTDEGARQTPSSAAAQASNRVGPGSGGQADRHITSAGQHVTGTGRPEFPRSPDRR